MPTKTWPSDYIRKQTLTNAERYITPDLKEYETLILNADERVSEIEARLLQEINTVITSHVRILMTAANIIARVDVAGTLAEVAARNHYTRPQLNTAGGIEISAGRHPVIEQLLHEIPFTPNDTELDTSAQILVITGPNMSGKSSYMRQVALIVLMAQIGSYVPAQHAKLGLVDRVFTRIGAQDELTAGQSTFMVEMVETAHILRNCTPRSLVILDEIGRGTSTYDGLAIAWAVAEHLHDAVGCRALFATHYHELTELSRTSAGLVNVSVSAREHDGGVVFLHSVQRGPASRSYGIAVARLAGVPESVLGRARAVLHALEANAAAQTGAPVSTPAPRTGSKRPLPQLDLFASAEPAPRDPSIDLAIDTIRSLDVQRTTPLDALSLLAKLQASLGGHRGG